MYNDEIEQNKLSIALKKNPLLQNPGSALGLILLAALDPYGNTNIVDDGEAVNSGSRK